MKVKELLKTVNVAWSPPAQYPILLAAGTAAQQLDASFNTSASLDLYSINLQQPGYEMELKASVASEHRYHKIIWGAYGNNPAGIIVGGCDYGVIQIYSASKMLNNENNCLISSPDRHTGPVRAMDFNPFQANLLATGATESQIYIWDVVNVNTPMKPGSESQPLEDVQYIAWNKQVQHILASTFLQRCVIWDLRKNEPIIKLTDANSKVRWKVVQWHPNVATQLCLASEDDQAPVIELWDLRFATSPLKTLQNHQRGVLSIAWNPHDPDLLLSCAKDNRILCWNPNSNEPNGEVICELTQTNQWNFDVSWCPRHPGLIVGTSFDGHAAVYSLLGGRQEVSNETSNKIVDSFPGMDPFTQPHPTAQTESIAVLTKAPKWLKRPFGASFGFGGKLIIFENETPDPNLPMNSNRKVLISQVITQPDLIQRSNELEDTLKSEQYADYCKGKIDNATDEHTKKIWSCVKAYFNNNVTKDILDLLGYNIEAMNNNLNQYIPQDEINTLAGGIANLNNITNGNIDGGAVFDAIVQEQHKKSTTASAMSANNNFKINISDDDDGLIAQAILLGNIEAAVSLCFKSKRYADAVILSMTGGPELLAKTQYRYFSEHSGALNSIINSLVSENWTDIVKNVDINCWKEVLIGIFTHGQERSMLCDMLGDRLASSENPDLKKQAQICYICSGNLNKLIEASGAEVQEIVELIMIMQKALEFQGIRRTDVDGKIANVLTQYAEMLAAEGNLESALSYLDNSKEQNTKDLKNRLCRALGYIEESKRIIEKAPIKQSYNEQTHRPLQNQNFQNTYNPLSQTTSAIGGSSNYNWNATPIKQSFGTTTAPYNIQSTQSFVTPSAHTQTQSAHYDQYPTGRPYGQQSSLQSPPPPPPTSGSNTTSNSRPSSVGPQSRSKYLIDPSVKSTPSYGQSTFQQPFTQQPQSFSSQQQTGSIPGYNVQYPYQTQAPVPGNTYPGQSHNFMNIPSKETESFKPPLSSSMMSMSQNSSQVDPYNQYNPEPISQMSAYSNESSYNSMSQSSGWNDPPMAKSSRAQAKYEFQSPILHPLRNTIPQPEPNILPQDNYYNESQTPYNPQQYVHNIPSAGTQYNKPVDIAQPVTVAKAMEPEKAKPPIPEEHMHLKTVFDELKMRCFESAKNPQIKRKIEDVSKKLEILYDCLRENRLSQNTIQGLHQISEMVQSGNYSSGLSLHTQLVSGPDFSQISSFMPGIKVLLQSALQLGIYIR
ncbi:PREDICTED: protein transport protein Sec31A isoform X2 [Polistes dominula]|uniref:Protein transport protein Sec31A isoform X2 n=1 Tax=Polistes dominula TaxID=743375 RepID=A0ABM1I8E0_POLDO|nr:PREDICTED: protein transport protein Sec31A isoform X2 [Polistes dominula]